MHLKGKFAIFYMLAKYVPSDIKYIFTKFYRYISTNNEANRKFVIFPRHCRPPLQKKLGRGSPFNVSYQHCCKKNINVNDSQNLAFATSHFEIELLLFYYKSNQKQ
jgi:hypothetical protein